VAGIEPDLRGFERRRRNRQVARIAGAVMVAAAFVAVLALWAAIERHPRPQPANHAPLAPTAVVPVGIGPLDVAVGDGAVWVADGGLGQRHPGVISRVPLSGRGAATKIPLNGLPPLDVDVGAGGVWALERTLDLIDPGTGQVVRRYPYPHSVSRAFAIGYGSLWLVHGDQPNQLPSLVSRIDPATGQEVATIPLRFEGQPLAIATGAGGVWVGDEFGDIVARIDPRTNSVVDRITVGQHPEAIVVGLGGVWVADRSSGDVTRIDPSTDRVTATVAVGGLPSGIAIFDGAVWVTDSAHGTVIRIDPVAGRVTDTVDVATGVVGVAAGGGALWVTVPTQNLVFRMAPQE